MKSRTIALYGIIIAVVAAAYYADSQLSMLALGGNIRIAVVTIISVLTLCQLFDFKTAVFSSTVFGLLSFLFAYTLPNLTSPLFMNPLISVVPRVVIGIVSYSVFSGMRKITAKSGSAFTREVLPRALAGGAGVVTNTVLVLSMMAVFKNENIITKVIGFIVTINFPIELLSGVIIVPLIAGRIARVLQSKPH